MKKTIKKLYGNFNNSHRGLRVALGEHSFLLEVIGGALVVLMLFFTTQHLALKFAIVAAMLLLLSAELLNTAIERICNKITRDYDEDIRDIKDMASAAVFMVLLINAMLVFYYIFSLI